MLSSPMLETRRRLSPDDRRRELLAFGRAFFAQHPADAFSMAEIAERAGVSKGLLYNYFGGRRGFYVATVSAIAEEMAAETAPEPGVPFETAFGDALARYVAWAREHGPVFRVLIQGGLGVDDEVSGIVESLRRVTVDRIVGALGIEPSPTMSIALYGWVCFAEHACLDWLGRQDEVSAESMVRLLTGALRGAMAAAGTGEA